MGGHRRIRGFTLIEMSLVLVIIGLIVGGILVGQSLVSAAQVQAQITQIEKYQQAVNTFRGKFNAIPGDMRPELSRQYGFYVGAGCTGNSMGQRNGDGLIDGFPNEPFVQGAGETELFWQDISSAAAGNLVDGVFPDSGIQAPVCGSSPSLAGTQIGGYFPTAKIGHGNYLAVYETSGANWYSLSAITSLGTIGNIGQSFGLPVIQAYKIDAKIDDGLPQSGNVQAQVTQTLVGIMQNSPNTTTSGGNATSCFDTTTSTYSVTVNNGSGANCALSFKFN